MLAEHIRQSERFSLMRLKSRSVVFGSAFAFVLFGTAISGAHAAAGAPTVLSVSPSTDISEGGAAVVITGTNFFNGGSASAVTSIQFGITVVQKTNLCPPPGTSSNGCFTVPDDNHIDATTPGHPKTAPTVDVTVTTAAGTSATGAGDLFTFTANAPQPASLSIHSGAAGSSITVSPLTGSAEASAFDFATSVQFVPASGPTLTVSTHPCPTSGPVPSAGCFQESADLVKLTAPSTGFTYGTLYHVQVTTAGGTSPASSGDQFTFSATHFAPHNVGAPQVAVTPDGSQQIVFWKDTTTNQLAEAWYTGVWNGPVGFPQLGTLTSTPAVAVTKDGSQQLVFWEGPGGHLFEAWYALAAWHGPVDITNGSLGGHAILGSAPSVVTTKDGSQLVFWRGTGGHLGEAWYAAGGWHGPADFTSLGSLASSPSATITADGSQQLVFFQGTNGLLTEDWYALGSWHGPMQFGAISSPPSVTVTPDGSTQLVFSRTAAGHLQESWYTLGSWHGPIDWTNAAFGGNGLLTSSPSATVTVDGSTQIVFWQGAGSTLWEGWYTLGAWHGPVNWSAG